MGNDGLFFIEPDGSSTGFFLMDPLLSQITSLVDNSRYICMPGSLAIQETFSCMSKFAGAVVIWLCRRSNFNVNHRLPGDNIHSHSSCSNILTKATPVPSVKCDLPGYFRPSKSRRKSSSPFVGKISSFALKQMYKEVEWLQSFPLLSLTTALVPPFTNVASNILASPLETGSAEQQTSVDQRHCEIDNQGCGGPFTDLHLQNLAWSKTIEPRTGIEFPTLLDNSISGESSSSFTPEVLVGTGSRIMTILRIKSLKVYAFGFYVHPFDVCEKLGPKYACVPEDDLYKHQGFYRDLLREDINMTVRLVISCNGIKINTVKDVFEKALRNRLTRTNPNADFSCLQTFGSMFSTDIPLNIGTTINFRRTSEGYLITEVGGNNLGAVHSKDLCRAFFDMYIGDIPVCEQTKEEIGKNVASIIGMC